MCFRLVDVLSSTSPFIASAYHVMHGRMPAFLISESPGGEEWDVIGIIWEQGLNSDGITSKSHKFFGTLAQKSKSGWRVIWIWPSGEIFIYQRNLLIRSYYKT